MPDASLSIPAIVAALGATACRFDVDVLAECDSTNACLLARAETGAAAGTAIAAERQTAGRGRLGRIWYSDAGASLTFSLLWRFPSGTYPGGLSLAAGVAVAEVLQAMGVPGIALKWPNDVLLEGRKLGGILVEMVSGAPDAAVIGVGLNLSLPAGLPDEVRAVAAALDQIPDRNRLLAHLLLALRDALEQFSLQGFGALRHRWLRLNAYADAPVQILSEFAAPLSGRCVGIAEDGALLLESANGVQRIISGEVSLRPA
jgi:BirA family biotin operon repressor/biotin-[acetyl-CoA-carboxylase] ligase